MLIFIGEKFLNSYKLQYGIKFGMYVETNELKIRKATFNIGNSWEVLLKVDNMILDNSLIVSSKLYIEYDNIDYMDIEIFSSKKVMIENNLINFIYGITLPSILYNCLSFSTFLIDDRV